MCGIAGIKRFGDQPIEMDWVTTLLVTLQHRGMDATGVALLNEGEQQLHFCKQDTPAWKFVTDKFFLDFMAQHFGAQTRTIILHTRAATKGNPRKSDNNHPMVHNGVAVVHNGCIFNDDTLFRELKLERFAETDSDIIRAILDSEGFTKAGIRRLGRMSGSAAIAALDPQKPGHLLLVRSGNPLVLAHYEGDFLVWASEKHCINKAMRRDETKFGVTFAKPVPNGTVVTMADNTAWLFGPDKLEWHDECKIAYSYTEPRRHVYDNYNTRQLRWDNEYKVKEKEHRESAKRVFTMAPKDKLIRVKCQHCKKVNKIGGALLAKPLEEIGCGACNLALRSAV